LRTAHLLILLSLVPSLLCAEEIQLKDGSKITGKITGIDGNTFQVRTAYGEIKVPRTEIVTIQFPENSSKKSASAEESSPVSESLDGTLYSNRTAHFQVTVPAGWVLAPELRQKEIVAALKAPDEAHFFMVTPEPYTGSLSTYCVLAETQYQSKFQDYQKLSESEAKLDGRTGLRMVWKGKPKDTNIHGQFLVYVIPYDDRMVRLSFYTLEKLFDDAVPMFEKIAFSYHSTSDKGVARLGLPSQFRPDGFASLSIQ
jgi:hypothetical protein